MTPGTRTTFGSILGLALAVLTVFPAAVISPAFAESPPKVLILPFRVDATEQREGLQSFRDHVDKQLRSMIDLLGEHGSLIPLTGTQKALQGKVAPESDDEARSMAAEVSADLVIYGYLSKEESFFRMKGMMWDQRTGRRAVLTDMKVTNIHGLPGVLQLFSAAINRRLHGSPLLPFYPTERSLTTGSSARTLPPRIEVPRNAAPWRSPELGTEIWAVAIGDLDGDKQNETVFLDDASINISRFENGTLRSLTQFSQPPSRFLAVEVADLDDGEPARLIVSSLTATGIESMIIKYQGRNLRIAQRIPNTILRAVAADGDEAKKILVGQRLDAPDIFTGEMERYEQRAEELVPVGKIALPPGTWLTSYAAGELGKKRERVRVILTQDQRLMVFDEQNRLLYHAGDRLYGLDRALRIPVKRGYRDIASPGRIVIADTDADGENELLVTKYSGDTSTINALVWDGRQLTEKWKTVGSRGIISDFAIQDFKNGGIRSLVLLLVRPNPFPALTGARTVVYAYDLIP
ncbi:MAG: VCBS repeat-containing protein [Desulfomonile tiedjei]|nr:VCBS repeat-containing protein [Desulfomonile tiedjei]